MLSRLVPHCRTLLRGTAAHLAVLPRAAALSTDASVADTFRRQEDVWHRYMQTGEGCEELFATFLNNASSSLQDATVPAADLLQFLESVNEAEDRIGAAELEELQNMRHKQLSLKDFKSWIRHASHDWNVHV